MLPFEELLEYRRPAFWAESSRGFEAGGEPFAANAATSVLCTPNADAAGESVCVFSVAAVAATPEVCELEFDLLLLNGKTLPYPLLEGLSVFPAPCWIPFAVVGVYPDGHLTNSSGVERAGFGALSVART